MIYGFLTDTYETERLKVLSVWAMVRDTDLRVRPHPSDARGRNLLEHMIHQCSSEDLWFIRFFDIDVEAPPLPRVEKPLEFIKRYAQDSEKRLAALRQKQEKWWHHSVSFFGATRSRAWIMVRRIAHSAHHRGQQLSLLRMLGRDLYSTYGPSADTGGLPADGAETIYLYPDVRTLLKGDSQKNPPPLRPVGKKVTERPD